MVTFSPRVIQYGRDDPLPERRLLHAGPLSAVLESGTLRSIKVGGTEIIRGIYSTVRDRNWGTVEPQLRAYEVVEQDGTFDVRFTAEHESSDVDFAWDGRIIGMSDGVIRFTMNGQARRDFLRNRIGFCVLHSMDLAGVPLEVKTPEGTVSGHFPTRISPHQPFHDIVSMRYQVSEGNVEIEFEGDLFEMEDQRNWTDASYKTFCTPLRLPFPVKIRRGERVAQSVTVRVMGAPSPLSVEKSRASRADVSVGSGAIGCLPPIGLILPSEEAPPGDVDLERLRGLRLAHVHLDLDLKVAGWEQVLREAAKQASAIGAPLELEIVTGDEGEGVEALVEVLARHSIPTARLFLFPTSGFTTTRRVMARGREAIKSAGIGVPAGGGSRAYFAEFNRADLPVDLMEIATYPINPQVHTFDNTSMVENMAAQAATVETARAILGQAPSGCPLSVGPITLKSRFNPVASGPEPEPGPGELPDSVDVRQMSLFAAGWTVGSIHHLAAAGVSSLTYYETTGWRGVMERANAPLRQGFPSRPGMLFPLYHVFADVGEFAGTSVLPVRVGNPLALEALALRADHRFLLLIANLTNEHQSVSVELPRLASARMRVLDETTADIALLDGNAFRREVHVERKGPLRELAAPLRPFAVAHIEGMMHD
jgi:D-apionolactonase